jgi:hypothetical protein
MLNDGAKNVKSWTNPEKINTDSNQIPSSVYCYAASGE